MENRILFGDCRERLREVPPESVDLVVTDPPYNTGLTAGCTRLHHFFADAMPADEYRALTHDVSAELYRVLKRNRALYLFINWKSLGVWLDGLAAGGFRVKNCIVWDKVVHGLNYQNYAYRHEFLIFAAKGRFYPKNRGTGDDCFTDVWRVKREMNQERAEVPHHETVKPYEMVRRPVEHASDAGDLVLDPFAGSGITCVVAKSLRRRYLGIERNPDYYRLCLRRLTELHMTEVSA